MLVARRQEIDIDDFKKDISSSIVSSPADDIFATHKKHYVKVMHIIHNLCKIRTL